MSKIILDTEPLVLLIIGRIDRHYIPIFKRTKQFSVHEYDLLEIFLLNFKEIFITPHIITEFSHLTIEENSLRYLYKQRIGTMVKTLFEEQKFTEKSPQILKILESNSLLLHGVGDASIEVESDKKIPIITSDGPFADQLRSQGKIVHKFIATEGFVEY